MVVGNRYCVTVVINTIAYQTKKREILIPYGAEILNMKETKKGGLAVLLIVTIILNALNLFVYRDRTARTDKSSC
jgi:hypothetical protein